MLEIREATKIFSAKQGSAISSVTFDVKDGEIVGFVGLNGAGKTTTIRIAVGVTLPAIALDGVLWAVLSLVVFLYLAVKRDQVQDWNGHAVGIGRLCYSLYELGLDCLVPPMGALRIMNATTEIPATIAPKTIT